MDPDYNNRNFLFRCARNIPDELNCFIIEGIVRTRVEVTNGGGTQLRKTLLFVHEDRDRKSGPLPTLADTNFKARGEDVAPHPLRSLGWTGRYRSPVLIVLPK